MIAEAKAKKDAARGQGVSLEQLQLGGGVLHPTHRMHYKRGVVWCWGCGAYGTAVVRHLAEPCEGEPTRGASYFLNRLRDGETPRPELDWPLGAGVGPSEGKVLEG